MFYQVRREKMTPDVNSRLCRYSAENDVVIYNVQARYLENIVVYFIRCLIEIRLGLYKSSDLKVKNRCVL